MNGDIYIRHQMKVSSQQLENTKPNEEVTQQNEPSTKTIDVNSDISGNGNGQVTIYLTNSNCNNVKVFIDGKYSGALTKCYQNESPSCGVQNYGGAIIKEMPVGDHFVTGRDDKGDTWSGKVSVIESVCITYALENFTQAR